MINQADVQLWAVIRICHRERVGADMLPVYSLRHKLSRSAPEEAHSVMIRGEIVAGNCGGHEA
jgi:hypothetical protein